MTEVPEHLLRRSRERRQALGLGGGEGGGEAAPAESKAVEPAGAAAPAPGGGAAPPAPPPTEPEFVAPPPPPPKKPARVPVWAMPVLLALPFWAVVYGGAFGEREAEAVGPVALGQTVYAVAGCGGCHGPNGQGGLGPAFADVEQTFPDFADHVQFVRTGSNPGQTYGATNKPATGGMPSFEDSLSEEEIIAVVCYERVEFGGIEPPDECSAEAGAGGAEAGTENAPEAGGGGH